MKTITIANHKGGVAKSQTAIELAYYLATTGKNVLVIDTDPQANASDLLLAGNSPAGRCLPEILIEGGTINSGDIMTRSFGGSSIDYVCNNIKASRIEQRISTTPREFIIVEAIKEVKNDYDIIVVDTPPSAELLGLGALVASDQVLIPVTPDKPSIDGVASLMRVIDAVRKNRYLNSSISVAGILVTRYRFSLSTMKGKRALSELYGSLVIDPPIRECTKVQQAVDNSRPVLDYDADCTAAKDYITAFNKLNL